MSHIWPAETVFQQVDVFLNGEACPYCEGDLQMCGHRKRRVFTLNAPQLLVLRVGRCADSDCPGHHEAVNPWAEVAIALPRLTIAWDVFAWIGHRRFARHWSVPQIRGELSDGHRIALSEDAIEDYVRRYETMVAARHGSLEELRKVYAATKSLILSIDGIQPEKGHETLYVVRELTQKRVWFAEPLLSSTNDEVRRLLVRAKDIAEALDRPVAGWMSDKQDAFVTGIAGVFPGTPHGYCKNHFLRDLAKPVLEADSHAKVQMRRKVRGLRSIEQAVLRETAKSALSEGKLATETPPSAFPRAKQAALTTPPAVGTSPAVAVPPAAAVSTPAAATAPAAAAAPTAVTTAPVPAMSTPPAVTAPLAVGEVAAEAPHGYPTTNTSTLEQPKAEPSLAGQVVLDYCAAVRGILTDDQGGPLHPPGLRMADALREVRQSLGRCLGTKKGGSQRSNCSV